MIRTVVYPKSGVRDPKDADTYADKLLKYVPAEVVAFFVPAYGYAGEVWIECQAQGCTAKWVILLVAGLGALGYLFMRAPKEEPPKWYFYVLAALAFLAWAVGTTTTGSEIFGLPAGAGELILLGAVFLIPMLDGVVSRLATD